MPIQPFAYTRNQSCKHPSTAVQYDSIDVHKRLLNVPKLPRLLTIFTSSIVYIRATILAKNSWCLVYERLAYYRFILY